MCRNFLIALVALGFTFSVVAPAPAQAPYGVIRSAKSLLGDACKLHSLLEAAGADSYTFRSACRLESSAELLLEKLSCPRSRDQVLGILDECALWYTRTSSGIQHDCRLHEQQIIRATLANAGRQLNILESSVACYVRDGGAIGHDSHRDDYRWNAPSYGAAPRSFPSQPGSWANGPFGESRSPSFPFGSEGFGRPGFAPPQVQNPSFGHPAARTQLKPNIEVRIQTKRPESHSPSHSHGGRSESEPWTRFR